MALGGGTARWTRVAAGVAGGVAGVLVVLAGALVAGGLVAFLAARRAVVLIDGAVGAPHRARVTDELSGLAAPDLPE
jgi:hypothetical protein